MGLGILEPFHTKEAPGIVPIRKAPGSRRPLQWWGCRSPRSRLASWGANQCLVTILRTNPKILDWHNRFLALICYEFVLIFFLTRKWISDKVFESKELRNKEILKERGWNGDEKIDQHWDFCRFCALHDDGDWRFCSKGYDYLRCSYGKSDI